MGEWGSMGVCGCAGVWVCGRGSKGQIRNSHTPILPHSHTPTLAFPGGSALILALWTLFFLATLALAVGAYVGANVELARLFRGRTAAYALARAAVEKGVMLAASDTNAWDAANEPWHAEEEFSRVPLDGGTFSLFTVEAQAEGVATNYGLRDEERFININEADRNLLAALFETGAGVARERAEALAEAVIDWRDPDDGLLTGGAEDEYYRKLSPPYHCHNGFLGSMQELRLVKGVDDGLFREVRKLATVYGSGRVNVNTAPAPVLMVLAAAQGGTRTVAASLTEKLDRFRDSGNAFMNPSVTDVAGRLNDFSTLSGEEADLLTKIVRRYMNVNATCFSGTARGTARGAAAGGESLIDFVFDRRSREMLYWYER